MRSDNQIISGSGWTIALGILMIILGIVAIASPVVTSIAAEVVLGWLFIIGSIVQLFYAFGTRRMDGSMWINFLLGLLYLGVGVLLLANPLVGVISLTLFIGIFYFVDGVFRVFMAFRLKPRRRWGWVLINGILMIILGILIWSQWPFNAPWILGILVGLGLLFSGIMMLTYGTTDQILEG